MRTAWGVPLLLLAAAGSLAAQDPQIGSPFHAGDWEVQTQVGTNLQLGSFVLLKYSTPTAAWYFFGQFTATKPHFGGSGGISGMPTPGYSLFFNVGRRFFRPVTTHALLFVTPTVDFGAAHNCDSNTPPTCTSDWAAGLGVNVGGEYLVTPFLGVGVLAAADISYSHAKELSGGVTTALKAFHANVSTPFGLMAFLHF